MRADDERKMAKYSQKSNDTYFIFTIRLQFHECVTVNFGRRVEDKRQPVIKQVTPQ